MFRPLTIVLSLIAFLVGFAAALLVPRGGGEPQASAAGRAEIVFYAEPNFQGHELHLFGDAVDLPYEDFPDGTQMLWNDNIGSIIVVSGTWRLYQNGRMNTTLDETPMEIVDVKAQVPVSGWSSVVSANAKGPLRIASPEHLGIGSDISSVQLVSAGNLPDWILKGR